MTRAVLLAVLFIATVTDLYGFRIHAGAVLPLSVGVNFAGAAGVWPGFIFGGGATAGADFLENYFAPQTRLGVTAYGMLTMDSYFLPADMFASNSRIVSYNIRYGADIRFCFLESYFVGFGPQFVYTFGGSYGSSELLSNFTTNMTGLDIYLTLSGGHEFRLYGRTLTLPVQARVSYDLTVPNAHVFEFGVSAALVWSWELWPDLPPVRPATNATVPKKEVAAPRTNAAPPTEPLKKFTLPEIQKLPVPDIIKNAETAMRQNENEYARLLVREGLVKEPDNQRLLDLLSRLISR